MAEQIKIAELSIDTNKLLTQLELTKKVMDGLSDSQKKMRESGDTSNKQFIQNEAKLKTLRSEYNSQIKTLQVVTDANSKLTNALGKENKSVDEAIQNNKELRAVRNQLNSSTVEGAKQIDEINKKLDENNEMINGNSSGLEQLKNNIGNYTESIVKANPILGTMIQFLQGAKDGLVAKNAAMKASEAATGGAAKGLRIFKIALASTGIGLLVIALGALITYLTTTQEGIDKVTSVLRPLKEVMNALLGVVQKLGGDLFKAFENPKQAMKDLSNFVKNNLINRFKAFGVILEGIMELDFKKMANGVLQAGSGVEDVIGKTQNLAKQTGNFFDEAYKRGKRIDDITKELTKSEGAYIEKVAELGLEFRKQNQIAEDTSKTIAEREAAAKKSIEILKDINKEETDRIKLNLELLELKTQSNDTSDAEKTEIAKEKATLKDRLAEMTNAVTTQVKKENRIRKQGNDEAAKIAQDAANEAAKIAQKRVDDAITKQEQELELLKETQRFEATTDAEKLEQQRKYAADELAILKSKFDAKKISETQYNLEKLKLTNDLLAEENRIKDENDAKDKERVKAYENRKRELVNEIALAGIEDDKERQKVKIEQDFLKHMEDLENLKLNDAEKLEIELLLKAQREQALADVNIAIKEENLKNEEEIEQRKRDAYNTTLDTIISIAGEETALGKAMLIIKKLYALQEQAIALGLFQSKASMKLAESTIDITAGTAKSASAAPFPANLPLIAGFVASVAGLLGTIKKTTSSVSKNPKAIKAERGMLLSGARHSSGGIMIEAEDGEAIINRNSSAKYLPLLSAINQDGGGVSFMERGGIAGSVNAPSSTLIDYDKLARSVAALPAPVVSVQEINTVTKRVSVIESQSVL